MKGEGKEEDREVEYQYSRRKESVCKGIEESWCSKLEQKKKERIKKTEKRKGIKESKAHRNRQLDRDKENAHGGGVFWKCKLWPD